MLMEQSSAVDLDWLLQSHGEIISDENSPDRHYRTVDEILLNYSSSSPSPPSSPSTSYSAHQHSRLILKDDEYVSTGVRSSRNQRWPHSHSSALVESDKYSSAAGPASNNNRTKSMGRVLPQLFGTGAIRSNAKPGAALAAAAAASRSITTPHATAIKLRRATTGVLKKSVSETTEKIAASDDSSLSPSAVASRVSENGSDAGAYLESLDYSATQGNKSHEEEEVKLEQFLMGNTNVDSPKTDAGGGYSAGDRVQENFDKVAEDATNCKTLSEAADVNGKSRVDEDDECKMPTSESQKASPIENEKDLALDKVNLNEQVFYPLLDKNIEEYPEVYPADESGKNDKKVGPTTILIDNDHKEDLTGGEETSDFGNVVAETGDGDAASTLSVVADMLGDLALTPEKKVDHTNLQQNSHPSLKPLELAEEIEKKQAFTGLHYEEGAAAQPMRLEGVPRGSTVLGYFDADPNNAITQTISSQAFRREHGSPQVVAVHLNYIAIGMSRGSIFVQPSKYTAHQVDIMDGKMMSLGLQGDRTHVPVTSMCFNQQGDLLFAGYGDGHYTVWDVQKASALKVITEHKAPVVHMLYLGQDTQVTRQFNVVSGDSKGVVKLIRFSVVPWLNRISYTKSMKLLDETTSRVVCASPLLYGEGHAGAMISSQSSSALTTTSISSMMGTMVDEGVVIFITHQSALVIMQALVEHYSKRGWLQRIEQCVLHMDILSLDFNQVCGHIHAIRHQYVAALDSYMKATHEPIYAFSFIHDMLRRLSNGEFDAFESAVISRIPDLFKLSREATYILIIDHFSGRTQYIFSELRSQPESLFLYLKTVNEVHTTGNLNLSCLGKVEVLDFPSASRAQQHSTGVQAYLETISSSLRLLHNNQVNMTDEMTELYFEFELLHNLEKDQKSIQIENVPQLRLAPPALYHEKVKKGIAILTGESTSTLSTTEKARTRRLGDVKVKGSFPLKSNLFGKGKINRR
ncbi:UNVERIFIED_CONTAM: hypothetical protein Sindi_1716100 [Sesamum indicum]